MAPSSVSPSRIEQVRHKLWMSVVFVAQFLVFSAQGQCEKRITVCYKVEELDPRTRHIFMIECNESHKYEHEEVIQYKCTTDVSISDLMHRTEPESDTKSKIKKQTTGKPLPESCVNPVGATLDVVQGIETEPATGFKFERRTTGEPLPGYSVNPVSATIASDFVSKKYIFTFLHITCNDPTTEVFIGTELSYFETKGHISFPLKSIPDIDFSLSPGDGQIFQIPSNAIPNEEVLNQVVDKAIMIASDQEVVVYGHQRCNEHGNNHATAFSVIGINDLGTGYWVITHQHRGTSQAGVVATSNNTNITINGVYINTTLILNEYQTFYFGGPYDLTGTYIKADKVVLVIAGNSLPPYSKRRDSRDFFYKCLPPTKDWGKHFNMVHFTDTTQQFTAKILSSRDNCRVDYLNDKDLLSVSLGKGEVKHLTFHNKSVVNSSEGILVAQFLQHYRLLSNPSILFPSPYRNADKNEFIFPVFKLKTDGTDENSYINVWLPPGGKTTDLLLDNKTVIWNNVFEGDITGYRVVTTRLSLPGSHTLRSIKNITAIVYGIGFYKIYSYSLH